MAVYRIFPQQDTFISTEESTGNAGKDEIVELAGYPDQSGIGRTSRVLVKYNTSEITNVLDTKVGLAPYSASLHFYLADAYELPVDYTVYGYPLYESWENGIGKFGDLPVNTSGVSWENRGALLSNPWTTNLLPAGVTASFQGTPTGGGNWYTASAGVTVEASQQHLLDSTHDLDLDVTTAISQIHTGALVNNGFILKLQDDLEYNTTSSMRIKYFGADTNTIYPPFLEFKWDDSIYDTGSLGVLNNSNSTIKITNNKGKYTDLGKQRFRFAAKPKYPVRTFTTSSIYLTNYALPQDSYWGLRDENTEEMVVGFDTFATKISCDSQGSFFDIYMDGLQPERYYRILVKTTLDGSDTVIDNQNIFKVVRNG